MTIPSYDWAFGKVLGNLEPAVQQARERRGLGFVRIGCRGAVELERFVDRLAESRRFRRKLRPSSGHFERYLRVCVLLVLVAGGGGLVLAQPLVRVPVDAPDLEAAVKKVSDGGTIEFLNGTYNPPPRGWELGSVAKSFTVRAQTPGAVILDGQGIAPLVILKAGGSSGNPTSGVVRFEGLVFRNGASDRSGVGGALTSIGRRITVLASRFEDNQTTGATGGGGLLLGAGSDVVLDSCQFEGNRSITRGGALEVVRSELTVRRTLFRNNRVNLGSHQARSVGGVMWVLDSTLNIEQSTFEENQAGYAGGAIYGFGSYDGPSSPSTRISISSSVFRGNLAIASFCCPPPGPTQGAAIFIENDSRLDISGSLFEGNRANWGAAISSYRATTAVTSSIFRNNLAHLENVFVAAGGTFIHLAVDLSDESTGFGAINRPAGGVSMTDVAIVGPVGVGASQGGCLFISGDTHRQKGVGVPSDTNLAANRAPLNLRRVVFHQCKTEADSSKTSLGGAVFGELIDLDARDVLFADSRVDQGPGGAMFVYGQSRAVIRDSAFGENFAANSGGALSVAGSHLEVTRGLFVANGTGDAAGGSTGADVYTQPATGVADLTGFLADSVFRDSEGRPLVDADGNSGFFNKLTYDGNRFHNFSTNATVLLRAATTFQDYSVNQLNVLAVKHAGKTFQKSNRDNTRHATDVRGAFLLAVPPAPLRAGVSAQTIPAYLGYAWAGDTAVLDGTRLADAAGLLPSAPGKHVLSVDAQLTRKTSIAEPVRPGCEGALCLGAGERFRVRLTWNDGRGGSGVASPVVGRSTDSGMLWFFSPSNWEVLAKIIDGCGLNQHRWFFAAATTNVGYQFEVTDLDSGLTREYSNPPGQIAFAITDTSAFPCGASATTEAEADRTGREGRAALRQADRGPMEEVGPARVGSASSLVLSEAAPDRARVAAVCADDGKGLCLLGGKIRVEVDFRTSTDSGTGSVVPLSTSESGLFWFFSANNWEMLVKVLDACPLPGSRLWLFSAATTNVEYTLRVTDIPSGRKREYFNPLGRPAQTIVDTQTLDFCE